MSRRHYLISYDIADDKRRTRVFNILRDNGNRAQYSVFFCQLNRRELATVRGLLGKIIHHRKDQILIIDLGEAHNPLDAGLECLGQRYEPPQRVLVVKFVWHPHRAAEWLNNPGNHARNKGLVLEALARLQRLERRAERLDHTLRELLSQH